MMHDVVIAGQTRIQYESVPLNLNNTKNTVPLELFEDRLILNSFCYTFSSKNCSSPSQICYFIVRRMNVADVEKFLYMYALLTFKWRSLDYSH